MMQVYVVDKKINTETDCLTVGESNRLDLLNHF